MVRVRLFVVSYLLILGVFSLWMPVVATDRTMLGTCAPHSDVFDQVQPDRVVLESSTRSDSEFVGKLALGSGPRILWDDDGVVTDEAWAVDWPRYVRRALAILIVLMLLYADWSAVRAVALTPLGTIAPLAFVALGIVARALFVPCKVVLRRAYQRVPEVATYSTLPVWRVGGESIRYDLIAYEEFALLLLAGLLWLLFPRVRGFLRNLF